MIQIKTEEEIAIMREGGKMLAEILKKVKERAVPGVTTASLNQYAEELLFATGGKPSFKGYNGFPAGLCTSVNEVIVHGYPSKYVLQEGDILSLDIGLFYKGFHTDMAITVGIGKITEDAARLIRETKKALKRGIKNAREGNTFGDIGNTISRHTHKAGFFIMEGLCGHGVGRELHEEPLVLNEGKRHKGIKIKKGMVFCIEPMLSMGTEEIAEKKDGSGIQTRDFSLVAHFEHTIAITEKGTVVITEL
jgi:methionyl aminopeptidase